MDTHRQLFGPVVDFDHDFSGIVLVASDLDAPNRMSDPLLQPYTRQLLDSFGSPNDVTIAGEGPRIDRTPAPHRQMLGRAGRPQSRIRPPHRAQPPRPNRRVVLVDTELRARRPRRTHGGEFAAHVHRDRRPLVVLGAEQLLSMVSPPVRVQSQPVAGPTTQHPTGPRNRPPRAPRQTTERARPAPDRTAPPPTTAAGATAPRARIRLAAARRDRREELGRLLDRHVQDLGDGLALEVDLQRLPVVRAPPQTSQGTYASGEEVDLDLDGAVAAQASQRPPLTLKENQPGW